MVVFLIFPWVFNQLYNPQKLNQSFRYRQLDSLIALQEDSVFFNKKGEVVSLQLFAFNPNTASESDLKKIMGERIGKRVVNFRSKGGKFLVKSDLLKIYGLDKSFYSTIENYINLPDTISKPKTYTNQAKAIVVFDINKADSLELELVKGIGKKLASRIIKYRDKLGGFISESQYAEVYGLDSAVVAELQKYSFVEEKFYSVKININEAGLNDLSSHPYLGRKIANSIIQYRNQHGVFTSLMDLQKIKAIPENSLQKIMPYLSLD